MREVTGRTAIVLSCLLKRLLFVFAEFCVVGWRHTVVRNYLCLVRVCERAPCFVARVEGSDRLVNEQVRVQAR